MPVALSTARLALQRLDSTHLDIVHSLFADPGHSLSDGPVRDIADTEAWLQRRQGTFEGAGFAWYGLWLRTGTFVGTCGLLLSERCAPEPEIGYEIARPMRGRGLAREAAEAVTEAAHEFGVPRLWATVRTGNQASMRILSSLGYLEEHTEPDDRGALAYLYSIPDEGPTA